MMSSNLDGFAVLPYLAVWIADKHISNRCLCFEERVINANLFREHVPLREIGRLLGRSALSIQREVRRNHSAEGQYRAETAQLKACARRLWPKIPKLLASKRLWDYVCAQLRAQWSPEEISNRLPIDYPRDKDMHISLETIYDAFYLQAKGRLKDLGLDLLTGRSKRKNAKHALPHRPSNASLTR